MIHLYGIKREANYFMGIYHLSEFKDNIEFLCKKGFVMQVVIVMQRLYLKRAFNEAF